MEPVSLAASIAGLADAGFSVGKFLFSTYNSYQNAPSVVLEVAHEVNICCFLMAPLGERLKAGSVKYNDAFKKSLEFLLKNSNDTFKSIRRLVPDDGEIGRGMLPRWRFVINEKKIKQNRDRLRGIQQTVMFMQGAMPEAPPVRPSPQVAALGASAGPTPITLTGTGKDSNGDSVIYSATLVTRPMVEPSHVPMRLSSADDDDDEEYCQRPMGKLPMDDTLISKLEKEKLEGEPKKTKQWLQAEARSRKQRSANEYVRQSTMMDLGYLRQSPYFSKDLIERSVHRSDDTHDRSARSRSSDEYEVISDDDANRDALQLADKWFGDSIATSGSPRPQAAALSSQWPSLSNSASPSSLPLPQRSSGSSPRSPASPFTSPSPYPQPFSPRVDCDSCRKQIFGTRYMCNSCEKFDFCQACFEDPNITIRHRHSKTVFMELRSK